jgi:uncharacterized RmlC-like cupin family protein
MDAENFAEWYRRQGHHVFFAAGSYWFNAGPRVYQAFPFDWLIKPTDNELREMMYKYWIFSLRYSLPLESPIGKVSYHVTLSNPYNLNLLRSQARNAVKRGLTKCEIQQITFERLAEDGWNLQWDTLKRQGRLSSMTEADWKRICYSAVGLAGFEAWAAVVEGELAASLIISRIGDMFYVPYALSHRKYLDIYVNNALFFSVSCNLLAREGVKGIFFTVQSLDAPKSVDDFKFRMGFNAKAVRQRVVFNPILDPFINKYTYRVISNIKNHYPEKASMAKVDGMIRFYLDGKMPLNQQKWPECLEQLPIDLMKTSSVEEDRSVR